ncbi:MAG: Lrp/AsnC family transcriptional regulator [Clostridiales bacterium]|nr:Lrp/AsnC family transcriptional regulator [Clostridiales bacterium]
MADIKIEVLEMLSQNSRIKPEEIATMLGRKTSEIENIISELEEDNTIVKYNTIVNWDKVDNERVSALIEVRVTPQRDMGFDSIAKKLYHFPEVTSVYLMSGAYDLCVMVKGKSMKDVAYFVAQKLSVIEEVQSTATHFVLKTYKTEGIVLDDKKKDGRGVIRL